MKKLLEGKKQKKVIISACRKIGLEGELCYKARKVWIRRAHFPQKKTSFLSEEKTANDDRKIHSDGKIFFSRFCQSPVQRDYIWIEIYFYLLNFQIRTFQYSI